MTDPDAVDESLNTLWATEDPIFRRKELLDIEHIPTQVRIIGRDTQIDELASTIHPAVSGGSPRNSLIYGKPGTGKSLVVKHVTQSATRYALGQDIEMATAYIDCTQANTETRAVIRASQDLNETDATGISIPVSGLATGVYYERFWEVIEQLYDVVLIILDEVDKLQDYDILMQLSRAGESGKVSNCSIGIIGISNKITVKETVDERIRSSLQDREFVFPPYDATQLRSIMKNRTDAFEPDVLGDETIPLTAALAAKEHGDARKALDILRNAGEIARDAGATAVTEEHVREADEKANIDRFHQLLDHQPLHAKLTVYALTVLSNRHVSAEFTTQQISEMYTALAEQISVAPLSNRRMRKRLNEQVFLDIIGSSERVGHGFAEGVTNTYHLLEEPDVILSILQQDEAFEEVAHQL